MSGISKGKYYENVNIEFKQKIEKLAKKLKYLNAKKAHQFLQFKILRLRLVMVLDEVINYFAGLY